MAISDTLHRYLAFDLTVLSNLEFRELEVSSGDNVDIAFTIMPASEAVPIVQWFHHWYADEQKQFPFASVARETDGFRLRFPGVADFLIGADYHHVRCFPLHGIPSDTINHLFLDHVLPRMVSQMGNLVLHASGVELAPGFGIAIAGESGWGKSTLSNSFQGENERFLGDDCLEFKVRGGELVGVSAYQGTRLWQDSVQALFPAGIDSRSVSHYSDKLRIQPQRKNAVRETVFKAVFFLHDPSTSRVNEIHIEKLHGAKLIVDLIRRSFLLDVQDMHSAARQFQAVQRLITARPQFFSLQYPRDYARLGDVREAILNSVSGLIDHRVGGQEVRQG